MTNKNWWLRFGCFLTGYNYQLVTGSSEVAVKSVKRNTSALLIVCILWAFIGYTFASRYLKCNVLPSLVGALVMCVVVVQIERQIILATRPDRMLYIFRSVIAVVMALLGSIIMDQIIFKEDIERAKTASMDNEVDSLVQKRTAALQKQIRDVNTLLLQTQNEKMAISSESPMVHYETSEQTNSTSFDKNRVTGISQNLKKNNTNRKTVTSVPNPRYGLIPGLNAQIAGLLLQKQKKDSILLEVRPSVAAELKSYHGFIDELKIMFGLITGSGVALCVWLMWILFFLGIELFILVSKKGEGSTDYESTIEHQMTIQLRKLGLLSRAGLD